MRNTFSELIQKIGKEDEKIIFLTGDLGYKALENVRGTLGDRFINAGVAEQNMVGVAAGMANKGYKVFAYSIAPFIVYRCLEQTRNDVCLHNLPVFLVGNGGGYGYGIMGSSHHAIEDIACLAGLQNMNCHVPAFTEDVADCLKKITDEKKPAYLRLGLGKNPPGVQKKYSSFNHVLKSETPKATILAMGPIVNNVIEGLKKINALENADVFTITRFPFTELPEEIRTSLAVSKKLMTVEEHIAHGGLGQQFSFLMNQHSVSVQSSAMLHAKGYPDKTYGNQDFHQRKSGIDADSISSILKNWI